MTEYEFRPLPEYVNVLRYNNGLWTPDDGEFDIVFICKSIKGYPLTLYVDIPYNDDILWSWCPNNNWYVNSTEHPQGSPWHYMTKSGTMNWDKNSASRSNHPNVIVNNHGHAECSKRFGCSNGGGPEFKVNDPYFSQGLVRNKETKEVIVPPEVFKCVYCGPILWKVKEQKWTQKTLF